MGIVVPIFLLIVSYLLGSIPWALIVSKLFKGIDIRDYGSKNMGATNVLRVLGFKYGLLVFIFDALKAGIVILLFRIGLLDYTLDWMVLKIHPLIYGVVALIGHLFPIFANFRGGKGVSCCAGIVAAYNPVVFIIAFTVFALVFIWKRYISLSSLSAITAAFLASFIPVFGKHDLVFTIVLGVGVVALYISHIPNIKRLIKHTEKKTKLFETKDI